MARLDTPPAPDGGLPLLAGPLPQRLLRCLHTLRSAAGHLPSRPLDTGAGLAWALASAWSLQACRARAAALADLVGDAAIATGLRGEAEREARALEHVHAQVAARLRRDLDSQSGTRAVLAARWEPLPARAPDDDVQHLLATLFGAPRGRAVAAGVDERIDSLPGLDGLGLMVGAIDRWAAADRWAADVLDLRTAALRRSPVPA